MEDIDQLLFELASTSAFSSANIHASSSARRKPREILRDLYRSATPSSAALITQIILKDLRPLLYPLTGERHYTAQLLQYNSRSVTMLTKEQAMWAWDPTGRMAGAYKARASLEHASEILDGPRCFVQPRIGTVIAVCPLSEVCFVLHE